MIAGETGPPVSRPPSAMQDGAVRSTAPPVDGGVSPAYAAPETADAVTSTEAAHQTTV